MLGGSAFCGIGSTKPTQIMKEESKKPKDEARQKRAPDLKQGTFSDGHPLDEVHYLECKIILKLKGERFTSVENFGDFSKIVRRTAEAADVDYSTEEFKGLRPQIREVLFLDTQDFRLYNNAFILRRRVDYVDGFAVGDPEIVFKFRHSDLQKAAEMDVRPKLVDNYQIKFKAEALPLKDQIGGLRLLYSHNAQFPLSRVHEADRTSMKTLANVFPVLATIKTSDTDKIELVNTTAVEEVLLDIGMLDFGKGVKAKANVAVWRTRGDQKQLVGEFAFQCKFQRRNELHDVVMKRAEQFFCSLQQNAQDWISLGTTKTGAVYRLKGNPPQSHE
jgi:hypothetical protein